MEIQIVLTHALYWRMQFITSTSKIISNEKWTFIIDQWYKKYFWNVILSQLFMLQLLFWHGGWYPFFLWVPGKPSAMINSELHTKLLGYTIYSGHYNCIITSMSYTCACTNHLAVVFYLKKIFSFQRLSGIYVTTDVSEVNAWYIYSAEK